MTDANLLELPHLRNSGRPTSTFLSSSHSRVLCGGGGGEVEIWSDLVLSKMPFGTFQGLGFYGMGCGTISSCYRCHRKGYGFVVQPPQRTRTCVAA
jgi:hypothetical protein